MRKIIAVRLLPTLALCALQMPAQPIQQQQIQGQVFEVATIRPIDNEQRSVCMQRMVERVNAAGRFHDCNSLGQFFVRASGLPASQIEGLNRLPDGMYEIQATYASPASEPQIRSMLSALLGERLQLKTHTETRETTLYELSIGPSGHKLIEADIATTPTSMPDVRSPAKTRPDGLPEVPAIPSRIVWMPSASDKRGRGTSVPMTKLVDFIAGDLAAPVVDRTGLSANYNFTLEFANSLPSSAPPIRIAGPPGAEPAEPRAADPARFPPLTTALRDQLGLLLEKKKGPARFVIIDYSASKPIDN